MRKWRAEGVQMQLKMYELILKQYRFSKEKDETALLTLLTVQNKCCTSRLFHLL